MNTVQTGPAVAEKFKNMQKSQPADKNKDIESTAGDSAKQAKKAETAAKSAQIDKAKEGNTAQTNPGQEKLEVSDYLKTISRLENKLKMGDISDEDLDKITDSLEERILTLSDQQKLRLKKMEFFKERSIDNTKELKKSFVEMFKNPNEQDTVFGFLKSPEFMTILLNKQTMSTNYAGIMNQNQMSGIANQG